MPNIPIDNLIPVHPQCRCIVLPLPAEGGPRKGAVPPPPREEAPVFTPSQMPLREGVTGFGSQPVGVTSEEAWGLMTEEYGDWEMFNDQINRWTTGSDVAGKQVAYTIATQTEPKVQQVLLAEFFDNYDEIPQHMLLYRVERVRGLGEAGRIGSFFGRLSDAKRYARRLGMEDMIFEYVAPVEDIVPTLSGEGEVLADLARVQLAEDVGAGIGAMDEVAEEIADAHLRNTYLKHKEEAKKILDEIGDEDLKLFHQRYQIPRSVRVDPDISKLAAEGMSKEQVLELVAEADRIESVRKKLLLSMNKGVESDVSYDLLLRTWHRTPDSIESIVFKGVATEVDAVGFSEVRIPEKVLVDYLEEIEIPVDMEQATTLDYFRGVTREWDGRTLTSHDEYLRIRAFNQAYMERLGIEEVELFRGTDGRSGPGLSEEIKKAVASKRKVKAEIRDNYLVGYSSSEDMGHNFGTKSGGVTVRRSVRRKDVIVHEDLFVGITRMYEKEHEFIIRGGTLEVDLSSVDVVGDGVYVKVKEPSLLSRKLKRKPPVPKGKPMLSSGSLEACTIGGLAKYDATILIHRPKTCRDYYRTDDGWFHEGEPISDPATLKRLEKLRIPPAWTNVAVATDPEAKIQAIGMDSAGRWQYRYSAKHIQAAARKKFERIKSFSRDVETIRRGVDEGLRHSDPRAMLLRLEEKTAIRVGSLRDYRAKKKAYGLTTLLSEHVTITGDAIHIEFPAKKGIMASYVVRDPELAAWLAERKAATRVGERLFPDVSSKRLNRYLRSLTGGKKYTLKDFRTYHGTRIAYEELKRYSGKRLPVREKRKIVKQVLDKVSSFLHNTPTVAKQSYIDPMVWELIGGLP